ncbi:hypothetical protein F5X98DRAFT_391348 [Xylaria grammica]|nr:hypothetical protein F5X98DRAFT_391348 [Xylaria grammica]
MGEGILKPYLLKPDHVIISANRDSRNAASKALLGLPTTEGTKHIITNIDCDVPTVLTVSVADVKAKDIQKHINTNAYGFIHLSQAFQSTLKRSEGPVWVTLGIDRPGDRGAEAFGYKEAAVPVAVSAVGIVSVVDAATRETHSGKMWTYEGKVAAW